MLSCDHSFRVKYKDFVKNLIIVDPHHFLPLSVQIALWMILIVFDLIPFCDCLHFFDRSLCLESDFWSFTFCRLLPRWGQILVWKAASSHFVGTVITHEDFLRLIFRNSFYALLCRRSVCTTLSNFNFNTFIRLANCNNFTSCKSACLF